jgi:hypothetical protein
MRRKCSAPSALVELIHHLVEPFGVRQPIALADVGAEHLTQLRALGASRYSKAALRRTSNTHQKLERSNTTTKRLGE